MSLGARLAVCGLLATLSGLSAATACAQEVIAAAARRNTGDISLESVEKLASKQNGNGPKLAGGEEADPAQWPASFFPRSGFGQCTATLVGPKALLLAAHCVGDGNRVIVTTRNDATVIGVCTHARDYNSSDRSADYALCKLAGEIADVTYETVNIDPTRVQRDSTIVLTGYGCTRTGGSIDGKFRTGPSTVIELPGEAALVLPPDELFPGQSGKNKIPQPNYITTKADAAVCEGDSGGGAYLQLTATKRLLISVNSKESLDGSARSYLSSLSSKAGKDFLDSWIARNPGEKICDVNFSDGSCRCPNCQ